MNKFELLSPVGSFDTLYAAIEAGADAVYFAGKLFGARAFAPNFSDEEIIEAIKICHLYGVKAYITVNTIIYENEVDNFLEYIDFLHKNNVDAVIMQDIGMIDLVRQTYPNLVIHGSTQMHIHNLDGVNIVSKIGLKRIVLARETSIEELAYIRKNTNIELEVFVHGALCVSYSGQCYMSTLIGPRSGNRGTCAQCCRQSYDILDENENIIDNNIYPLSTKELCTINDIGKLIDLGIDSFKIEGRMKSKEYVYLITSLYRKAMDNYIKYRETRITETDIINMKKIFNRDFTKGFLFNEENNNFINDLRPNHLGINLGKVVDYNNNHVYIKLDNDLSINDGIRFLMNEDYGLLVNDFYINKQLKKESFKNDIVSLLVKKEIPLNTKVLLTLDSRLNKKINDLISSKERKILLNIKVFNKDNLLVIHELVHNIKVSTKYEYSKNNPLTEEILISKLNKINDTIYVNKKININIDNNIFVPLSTINELKRVLIDKINKKRLYELDYKKCKYNRSVIDFKEVYEYSKEINKLPRVTNKYINDNKKHLVCELGALNVYKNVYTDYTFNVTNSYSIAFLHSLGAERVCLSLELNYNQIKYLIEQYRLRYKANPNVEVYSLIPETMISKYSLNKKYNRKLLFLKDKYGNKYKVVTDNIMHILNNKKVKEENYFEIGVNYIRK